MEETLLKNFIKIIIIISLPLILISMNVKILLNPSYLEWEYSKEKFPESELLIDIERLELSKDVLSYIKGESNDSILRDTRLFNEREISHLSDVRILVGETDYLGLFSFLILILSIFFLISRGVEKYQIVSYLFNAAVTTLIFVSLFSIVSTIDFNFLFIGFHKIFFPQGNWSFHSQDTLIQLYPAKFWFDSSFLIIVLFLIESSVLSLGFFLLRTKIKKEKKLK
ncbi:MAG: TIGR01906 family membrane protein [Candidatus Aenigmarchaeota archaeon]|nr:TIGR01906 family membrane protein [Candidatus Aenigmarchaeota archaeon]